MLHVGHAFSGLDIATGGIDDRIEGMGGLGWVNDPGAAIVVVDSTGSGGSGIDTNYASGIRHGRLKIKNGVGWI
jgi:hypothetical protein